MKRLRACFSYRALEGNTILPPGATIAGDLTVEDHRRHAWIPPSQLLFVEVVTADTNR
jgi:hypothetical protein